MAFVDGKCPKCGESIRVDNSLLNCYCNKCGSSIRASEAAVGKKPKKPDMPAGNTQVSEPSHMSNRPADPDQTDHGTEKPSGGKTFGVFLLCWFVIGTVCAIVSLVGAAMTYGEGVSISRPATGGLIGLIIAIVLAAGYRKSGELGPRIWSSAVIGVVLGIVAVAISPILWQMRWG